MSQASYLIVAEFKDKLPFIVAASFSLESLKGYLHNKPTKWEEQRRTLWRDPCDSVMFNNTHATYEACELLLRNGHRRIGIVTGPEWYTTANERLEGYKRALADYNVRLDPALLWQGEYSMEGGRAGTEHLLELNDAPTAILATNYHTTVGSLIMLNEMGVKMPEQLSFIGFEAIEVSRTMSPRPTMIRLPLEELGQKAADTLFSRITHQDDQPEQRTHRIRTELLEGESVAEV